MVRITDRFCATLFALLILLAVSIAAPGFLRAQEPDKKPEPKPERKAPAAVPMIRSTVRPTYAIGGSLVIGGGTLTEPIASWFAKLAGDERARIVVIPTASTTADDPPEAVLQKHLAPWEKFKPASLKILHTRDRDQANNDDFIKPLREATGVWLGEGDQMKLSAAYLDTAVHRELKALLDRGGVIGGSSAGAAVMSEVMIAGGEREPRMARGFGFLPRVVVDQHWLKKNRVNRLLSVLTRHPGLCGLGIDEETAVVIQNRDLRVVGNSYVTACLSPTAARPARFEVWKDGDQYDLVALCRAAEARAGAAHPLAEPAAPDVPGTLFIGGGGGMPKEIVARFIAAAGGVDAPLVVIPAALGDSFPAEPGEVRMLTSAGAKKVTIFHPRSRKELEDDAVLAPLKEAKGIWFTGGRQWRFVDVFEGTPAEKLFHDVLRRGGAIGGSSAGASIQSDFMVRGSPLGNEEMMAEGYERGFGFLTGTAVDQHFTQRNRHLDMTDVMRAHPQLLGIGIDESTVVIVHGQQLEVAGKNNVALYNRRNPPEDLKESGRDYEVLMPGAKYDLKTRRVIP